MILKSMEGVSSTFYIFYGLERTRGQTQLKEYKQNLDIYGGIKMLDRITIRIEDTMKEWLKEYAYQNRTSVSEVIRECVEQLKSQTNR